MVMSSTTQSSVRDLATFEQAQNDQSGFFSSESVLNILKLILGGSELSEVLTIIAQLVESQGNNTLCTIWLPDADGRYVYCAAAPSLPGFAANAGRMSIGPKGASCGTAVYRREPVYVADIMRESIWDDYRDRVVPYVFVRFGRDRCSRVKARSWALSPFTIVRCAALTPPTCR